MIISSVNALAASFPKSSISLAARVSRGEEMGSRMGLVVLGLGDGNSRRRSLQTRCPFAIRDCDKKVAKKCQKRSQRMFHRGLSISHGGLNPLNYNRIREESRSAPVSHRGLSISNWCIKPRDFVHFLSPKNAKKRAPLCQDLPAPAGGAQ